MVGAGAGAHCGRLSRRDLRPALLRSLRPAGDTSSYDHDTLTSDLDAVLRELDLRDVTLVGFSMGGGEVARDIGTYGEERVHSAVFAGAVPPCLKKDHSHTDALDDATVKGMQADLATNPAAFFDQFTTGFFSAGDDLKVTEDQRQETMALAKQADVHAFLKEIRAASSLAKAYPGGKCLHVEQHRRTAVDDRGFADEGPHPFALGSRPTSAAPTA